MNKATMEAKEAEVGEYFKNEDLFMLFKFDSNATESETMKILEKQHDMVGLRTNDFIKDHIQHLMKFVSGISDHSVIYK